MRMLSDTSVDASTAPLLFTPASASAAAGRGLVPPAGGSNASFDADMVIILAALLFLLVGALGLNSLIRCALHCGRTTLAVAVPAPPAATPAPAAASDAGMKRKAIRRIPVAAYEAKAGVPGTECAICLGEFADGDKVRLLPRCHHGFHVQCIDAWLAAHSSCPICRNSLLLEDGGAGEPTAAGPRTT